MKMIIIIICIIFLFKIFVMFLLLLLLFDFMLKIFEIIKKFDLKYFLFSLFEVIFNEEPF